MPEFCLSHDVCCLFVNSDAQCIGNLEYVHHHDLHIVLLILKLLLFIVF